jgi:CDGSH-type Zn-finger protein
LYDTGSGGKMAPENDPQNKKDGQRIIVEIDGPYLVEGGIPLVHKTQIVSENGEPITWKKDGDIPACQAYNLCRCGHSHEKPFCDMSHELGNFDGKETAETNTTAERQMVFPGSSKVSVKLDQSLCMESGYCGNLKTNIMLLARQADNIQARTQLLAMIGNCPAGAYTYALKAGEQDVEPDLPRQIAVTTEITSDGPIDGPLWVTGGIPIQRSDGQPFETRNRVTLCSCGLSGQKPLCDGTHRHAYERKQWVSKFLKK